MADGTRYAIGCMTGTSLDGLDAVLVRALGEGAALRAEVVSVRSVPLGELGERLRAVCDGGTATAMGFAEMALELGALCAGACRALAQAARVQPALVALHGQTVVHSPPVSWQMINPWPVAAAMNTMVMSDLRGLDLACGGQGAPITPMSDLVLFGAEDRTRVIVNLGGFCNITVLPPGGVGRSEPTGFDVCACNHPLNAVARARLGEAFDDGGNAARSGRVDEEVAAALRGRLGGGTGRGRSLGTGDELGALATVLTASLSEQDALATVCAAVGSEIGGAIVEAVGCGSGVEMYVAGGGAHNRALVAAIDAAVAGPGGATGGSSGVRSLDALGVPVVAREAAGMAVLGLLAHDGVEITRAGVTGRGPTGLRAGLWVRGLGGER